MAGPSPGSGRRQALAAYRARLAELDAELAEAESWADEGRLTRLRLERGALLDEVATATGLSSRPRRFSGRRTGPGLGPQGDRCGAAPDRGG